MEQITCVGNSATFELEAGKRVQRLGSEHAMVGSHRNFVAPPAKIPRSRTIIPVIGDDSQTTERLGQRGVLNVVLRCGDSRLETLHRFMEASSPLVLTRVGQDVRGAAGRAHRTPPRSGGY